MDPVVFHLRYQGQDADQHLLPAHNGSKSLEGITWAFCLLGHYLATGRIRKRGNLDPRFAFYIAPSRDGSFEQDVVAFLTDPNNLFMTSLLGGYSINTATEAINYTFKHIFNEVCGNNEAVELSPANPVTRLPSGDIEALADALEPAMIRAHQVVGAGATALNIQAGRDVIINLDRTTKRYVEANIRAPGEPAKVCRVSALNVNTGNGRVYIPDLGRTVAFSVVKEPEQGTYVTLSRSLERYTRGVNSDIIIEAQEILTVDGRLKKLLLRSAYLGEE